VCGDYSIIFQYVKNGVGLLYLQIAQYFWMLTLIYKFNSIFLIRGGVVECRESIVLRLDGLHKRVRIVLDQGVRVQSVYLFIEGCGKQVCV